MILAIDIGGTKTLLGLFNEKGKLTKTQKFETPADYDEFISILTSEANNFIEGKNIDTCVAAVPGTLDRSKGIVLALGNRPWENKPIGVQLTKALKIPVHIENDANLAGLSEALLLPDYRKVAYITVSTGIGGAYVVDGKLDKNLIDAEVGHMMLEHEGKLRTWESFASGKAIFNKFGLRASDITDPSMWYIVARNIAIGLIDVIATTTPDAIVIGGGVGSHLDKFKERLEEELKIYQTNVVNIPPIFQAKNPEEAVIYGCYAYAKNYKK
ncbi:ROK family protein [Candidatus Saccharibacteria bacterium]|nr:ROK family protein [Candidatus Saccharibacteria bacterium]